MPENFSLPSNISNEDPGKTPNQQEPGQRFSPPPSNVFIRTSESDLEKIKSEGGAISGMPPPPPPPPPPLFLILNLLLLQNNQQEYLNFQLLNQNLHKKINYYLLLL